MGNFLSYLLALKFYLIHLYRYYDIFKLHPHLYCFSYSLPLKEWVPTSKRSEGFGSLRGSTEWSLQEGTRKKRKRKRKRKRKGGGVEPLLNPRSYNPPVIH